MKVIRHRSHGGPEVLELASIPDPVAGAGEVVVEVGAAAVNRLDLLQRAGPGMVPGFALPHVPGMDVAGTIVEAGDGVDPSRVGERVVVNPSIACMSCPECSAGMDHLCRHTRIVGASLPGGYAEQCVVPASHALTLPAELAFAEAATWPTAYSTAWHALFESGDLVSGETLMIHGAASGVTSAAIQLASRAGARVIVTGRNDMKLEHARKLGAADVIDSDREDVAAVARDMTDGRGVDLIFDHVGSALFATSIESLRPRGRLIFCGTTSGSTVELNLPSIYRRGLRLIGAENYGQVEFERMIHHLSEAAFPSIVDHELPLAEAAYAHELVGAGEVAGKAVLVP